MKLLITGALLLAGWSAAAQSNRISAGLNALSMRNTTAGLPEQEKEQTQKETLYLPSIGYYRMLNGSFGIGVELGYSSARLRETNGTYHVGYTEERGTESEYQEFYVAPTLLESFWSANRKYNFIASLSLPLNYSPSTTSRYYQSTLFAGQTTGLTVTAPSGSLLRLGLFLNGGIQRRIVGGLFAGLQVGVGWEYLRTKAEGAQVTESQYSGGGGRTETQIDNWQKASAIGIRPMVSLNYQF